MAGHTCVRTVSYTTRDGVIVTATDASSSGNTSEDKINAALMGGMIGAGQAVAHSNYLSNQDRIRAEQLGYEGRRELAYEAERRLIK